MKTKRIEKILSEASTLSIPESKVIYIDTETITKLKSVCIDYPDFNISHTKLANTILKNWIFENKEELIDNLITKLRARY